MKRFQLPIYRIPYHGQWHVWTEKELVELEKEWPDKYRRRDEILYQYQNNRISFFLAHGVTKQGQQKNDIQRCLGDYKHDLILILAPTQTGKSAAASAYMILRLIPTDPEWMIFKEHGVEWHEWEGPTTAIAASYSFDNTRTLAEEYLRLLPREQLGPYAPNWGCFKGEKGKQKEIKFGSNARAELTLTCGSKIVFMTHTTQQIYHFEGRQAKFIHFDEQAPEAVFSACTQRQLTLGAYTPIIMSLTGYAIPGRPDTGAGGWIKTKLIDKNQTQGRTFITYKISVDSVPEAIMAKEQKKRSYQQWVSEPEKNNDIAKINEGKARYWGEWHQGGGLVFNVFDPDLHLIEEFDVNKYKPMWIRMVDHGQNPCAALLFALLPWGDVVVVKEYYAFGRSISENAKGIIVEMCGNDTVCVDRYKEGDREIKVYQERFESRIIAVSELDCRSYGSKESDGHRNYGKIFNEGGLACNPASGQSDLITIPLVKELMALRKGKQHINVRLGRPLSESQKKYGSPQLYIVSTCVNTITELKQYAESAVKIGVRAPRMKGSDHAISCLKFYAARNRVYTGENFDMYVEPADENVEVTG